MDLKVGDYVSRKSHHNDTVFRVINIDNDIATLKGVYMRLYADAQINDLIKENDIKDDFEPDDVSDEKRDEYFYLPGKILHIDGDEEYLEKCLKYYKNIGVYAIGKKIKEDEIASQIGELLKLLKPDVLVMTGHDAFYEKKGDKNNISNYKNSFNFVKAIRAARSYEKSQDKLVIIAGACQSDYEELIKAGANFASSPKRINIHALDPAIIAVNVALTKRNSNIDLKNILDKTKYGSDGMGGIITNGLMYVGYPR
jgi:spore coat assembly protein